MIVSLESEPRSGGVRVRVDAQPFGTISLHDVAELGLSEGADIGKPTLNELGRRSDIFNARTVALRMLAIRALPSREMARRLARKGHAKPAAEAAVQSLVQAGLIDDAEFARHHARTRARRKLGPSRLVAELRRFGIGEREADAAVAEVIESEGVDTKGQLREAARRKAASLRGVDPEAAKRRLRAYLLRRGYSGSEVASVVKEALAG